MLNKDESVKTCLVGLTIKIWSDDVDSLSDLMTYIGDKFSNSVVRWM